MGKVSMIGIDLAKPVFQLHGAAADGTVLFRRRLRREKRLDFLASQPPSVVALEACASAHYWGREIGRLGHEVRLIAPAYVKPFSSGRRTIRPMPRRSARLPGDRPCASRRSKVRRSKPRPNPHGGIFKGCDLLVRQRTATINALRGHLAEFGIIAPKGPAHIGRLQAIIEDAPNGLKPHQEAEHTSAPDHIPPEAKISLVNGGVKSGHGAAQKSASSGLGITRATGRQSVSSALQIAGG